ncbi:MAG TPA: ABC transporter ATP-binding protein [Pirellulales bacterium]|jgi:energy-coupling factor transporter ATP-binding protein EcfA2|nr:ABC transporter ATP-binding protein [Pirellulales bacterium]
MALVEVTDLAYAYPDGTLALHHVEFCIERGESVGLVGPNGAGKSSLLWHLNGLLPAGPTGHEHPHPTDARLTLGRGGVKVEGLDAAAAANLPRIRRMVGLMFQDPDDQLFCSTVREDVAFGPLNLGLERAEVAARVDESIAAVGLEAVQDKPPHHLSLGERKRACLAGVLACRPRLLALDEPTANLDPRARRQFIALLSGLSCAKLIASHDLEMICELCPRVIVLDRGEIFADGPTGEILADEALMLAHGLEVPMSLAGKATDYGIRATGKESDPSGRNL